MSAGLASSPGAGAGRGGPAGRGGCRIRRVRLQMRRASSQRGFSLVAAVFLIVVLAALGAFAARIALTQQQTLDLSLLEAQAAAAAGSGMEYGLNQALKHNQCASSVALTLTGAGLTGFAVVVNCTATAHPPMPNKTSYLLVATATRGVYGRADFVSRQISRTVTTP
jgi:MSHA biogenesis protein MshP